MKVAGKSIENVDTVQFEPQLQRSESIARLHDAAQVPAKKPVRITGPSTQFEKGLTILGSCTQFL